MVSVRVRQGLFFLFFNQINVDNLPQNAILCLSPNH